MFIFKLKERWEDLKKNISINPQGNRVRFVPIVPNNANRPNALPPPISRNLLFKPFIPKYITNCPGKENINLTQHINDKETKNMPVAHYEPTHYQPRFNMKNNKSVGLQFSRKQQEVKNLNTSTSFVDNYNMNALNNSLPKLPLRDIWKNDNSTKDFGCTLPQKNHVFKKPFAPERNYLSQTVPSTNYALNSKFQNKTSQLLPNSLNTTKSSQYFKPSYSLPVSQSQKSYPITDNSNTSFFTSETELLSSATYQNINTLEQNGYNYINQPFSMDDIWKNY